MSTLHSTLHILSQELDTKQNEVIIVDNGSVDGCEKFATIKNETNLGISKGKNQGIDASKGDYILLIDGDVVPVPNSISLLACHLDKNSDCMAIGFLPNKFCTKEREAEFFCNKLDPIQDYRGHCIYFGMYRRDVFDKIRFDESFGAGYGYEDLDSYMQMEVAGIKQWTAGINSINGKYYHAINSSINNKNCLGFEGYMSSSLKRKVIFDKKWQMVANAKQSPT